MAGEKPTIIVVSDYLTSDVKAHINTALEPRFNPLPPANLGVPTVNKIAELGPNVAFLIPDLNNQEQVRELTGIVRRLRKRLPEATLVLQATETPSIDLAAVKALVDGVLPEDLAYEFFGSELFNMYLKHQEL